MLTLTVPPTEFFNEKTNEFVTINGTTIRLEHSLVSLSKWESKWNIPFLSKTEKTREQTLDYIRCMTITQNVDQSVYNNLTQHEIDIIAEYIEAPMTATTFGQTQDKKTSREIITAEIVYYWMISFNIPLECQTWHLNRLLTLVNVCSIKNQPKGKGDARKSLKRQAQLNAARKQALNTTG